MKKLAKKKPAAKKDNGRPPKISENVINSILAALQAGAYIETAAAYAGIHKDTFYAWLKRGRAAKDAAIDYDTSIIDQKKVPESEHQFVRFSDAIEKALADSELMALQEINKASKDGHWQAAAWRLERKFPQRYGRRTMASASVAIGEGILDNGQNQGQTQPGQAELPGSEGRVLDPRNPPVLHLTLAIGDKEVEPGDLDT